MIEVKFRIVIIGGGIAGLATAYNIALQGVRDVAVVEKGYIGSGASVRNAAHFRHFFWSLENTRYAMESASKLIEFASKIRWNPEIHLGGYLWLLYDEKELEAYKRKNTELWSKLGVSGIILTPEEVSERYPYLNVEDVIAGFLGAKAGKVRSSLVVLGYREKAEELGVRFLTYTRAESIVVESGRIRGVETENGQIAAEKVLVAAGAWTGKIMKTVNIDLPVIAERKEIAVTERTEHFIEPLVINTNTDLYVGQMLNGEVIGSVDYPIVKGLAPLVNTLDWCRAYAEAVSELIPLTKHLMLLRSWSGYYAMTPDSSHIMGRDPEWPENLYVATGWSSRGFQFGPLTGELMARNILYDEVNDVMKPFLPTRFKEGKLIPESRVIG